MTTSAAKMRMSVKRQASLSWWKSKRPIAMRSGDFSLGGSHGKSSFMEDVGAVLRLP